MKENDKTNCFAWIDFNTCNALTEKDCKNCSFYKDKSEVKNYELFKKRNKKEDKK